MHSRSWSRHKTSWSIVKSKRPNPAVSNTDGTTKLPQDKGSREGGASKSSGHAHQSVKFDSVFISSLSGTKSEKHQPKTKKRKNRPGQRTRQKLWEELYGTKARHNHAVIVKSHTGNKAKRKGHGANKKLLQSEPVKESSSVSLHPSWEASRKKKEQESKLSSFQGQRIVFSESD